MIGSTGFAVIWQYCFKVASNCFVVTVDLSFNNQCCVETILARGGQKPQI